MSDLAEGHATPDGTRRYAERGHAKHALPSSHFRTFQGLSLSSLGMGTYLGPADEATDRKVAEAVKRSVESGAINVLDSAANYRAGRGERSVGAALKEVLGTGKVRRDEIFVCTKNGYVADPRSLARMVQEGGVRRDEIFSGCNCMSPAFLGDQLERSRQSLGLATIDLLYLHNVTDEQVGPLGSEEFLDRLRESFQFLEGARKEGKIRYYGLATWETFRTPPEEDAHLELEEVVELAREIGGPEAGFRFLQFPFNLRMPEAAVAPYQELGAERKTLLEAAGALGVGTLSSVPLLQGRLPVKEALQFARSAPGHLAPLVGHKDPRHVTENLSVAAHPPWTAEEFQTYLGTLNV